MSIKCVSHQGEVGACPPAFVTLSKLGALWKTMAFSSSWVLLFRKRHKGFCVSLWEFPCKFWGPVYLHFRNGKALDEIEPYSSRDQKKMTPQTSIPILTIGLTCLMSHSVTGLKEQGGKYTFHISLDLDLKLKP